MSIPPKFPQVVVPRDTPDSIKDRDILAGKVNKIKAISELSFERNDVATLFPDCYVPVFVVSHPSKTVETVYVALKDIRKFFPLYKEDDIKMDTPATRGKKLEAFIQNKRDEESLDELYKSDMSSVVAPSMPAAGGAGGGGGSTRLEESKGSPSPEAAGVPRIDTEDDVVKSLQEFDKKLTSFGDVFENRIRLQYEVHTAFKKCEATYEDLSRDYNERKRSLTAMHPRGKKYEDALAAFKTFSEEITKKMALLKAKIDHYRQLHAILEDCNKAS